MEREREAAALWWRRIKQTNNDCFLPLFFDRSRYLVLKGGGGSGKSIFAGRKVLERAITEPGHRVLVCRKVGRTLRESCFAQLRGQLAEHYGDYAARVNKSDMVIEFPHNGSRLIFAGLDDSDKLKSIYNVTMIWIEEASELLESDFNQLDIRLRTDFPFYLQMILSFNPISITHWLKKRFFDRFEPRARLHESTYRDNRFLNEEAVRTLEAFRETDEYYYTVYALGMWGVTGRTVFDGKAVTARLELLRKERAAAADRGKWKVESGQLRASNARPYGGDGDGAETNADSGQLRASNARPYGLIAPCGGRRGLFEYRVLEDGVHISEIRWVDDPNGPVTIYHEPESGRPYVIGGDTAGDGSDWFTAQVLDNVTGRQVAVLRHRYDEDTYARQVYCLGKLYGGGRISQPASLGRNDGENTAGRRGAVPYGSGRGDVTQGLAAVVSGHYGATDSSAPMEDSPFLAARGIPLLEGGMGEALIGIETNFSTYPTKLLELMGYRNLYVREYEDTFDGTIKHAYGFRTDRITRPVILGELVALMREHVELIEDETTLEEMLTFVRNEKQRPEAEPGAHDDLVMALAIAYHIRPQQRMTDSNRQPTRRKWTEDMWEDFRHAGRQEQAEMLERWGNPM